MAKPIKLCRWIKNPDGTTSKVWTGKWRARWLAADGKQKSDVFSTRAQAAKAIRDGESERDDIRSGLARPKSDKMLAEVVPEWIKSRPEKRRKDHRCHLDQHILP